MSAKKPHGIIDHTHINRKTDYLFRISMKGLIRNHVGKVLFVKETGRNWWDLPGGGMDHNESIKEGIARELYEEVKLTGDFTYRVVATEEPSFLKHANVWQVRLVFEIKPENMNFEPGEHGDEIAFLDPSDLKDSEQPAERKVYEYSLIASR